MSKRIATTARVVRAFVLLGCALSIVLHSRPSFATYFPVPAPTVTTTCGTCASLADLTAAAQSYFNTYNQHTPPGFPAFGSSGNALGYLQVLGDYQGSAGAVGTHLVVVSTAYAISGDFHFVGHTNGHTIVYQATPISVANDPDTRTYDTRLLARASKIPPVKAPSSVLPNDEPEIISQYLQTQLAPQGSGALDFWHGLTTQGQFVHFQVYDAQTGKTYDLYQGDTITIVFSDGSSMKVQWLGPGPTSQWKPLTDTYRKADGTKNDSNAPSGTEVSGAQTSIDLIDFIIVFAATDLSSPGPTAVVTIETIEDGSGGGNSATYVQY